MTGIYITLPAESANFDHPSSVRSITSEEEAIELFGVGSFGHHAVRDLLDPEGAQRRHEARDRYAAQRMSEDVGELDELADLGAKLEEARNAVRAIQAGYLADHAYNILRSSSPLVTALADARKLIVKWEGE